MNNTNRLRFFPVKHQQHDQDMVYAIKYEKCVTESMRDALNGYSYVVSEVYIPSIKCVYNREAIFSSDNPRYVALKGAVGLIRKPYTEIMLSKKFVDQLEQHLKNEAEIKRNLNEIMTSDEFTKALCTPSPTNIQDSPFLRYEEENQAHSCAIS